MFCLLFPSRLAVELRLDALILEGKLSFSAVGFADGVVVGFAVGLAAGAAVGTAVGIVVGISVGSVVGVGVVDDAVGIGFGWELCMGLENLLGVVELQ